MKSEHQLRVEELMLKIPGQDIPNNPTIPDVNTRTLRARLILEEALKTIEALGLKVCLDWDQHNEINLNHLAFEPSQKVISIPAVIDGCCDLKVVTTGTLSAFGIPDEYVQLLVDENNLEKFGPGGYRRDDGKWIKPPDHRPPDIEGWLRRYIGVIDAPVPQTAPEKCPACHNETFDCGYGLCVGPIGQYTYCRRCKILVAFLKDQLD